MKILFFGDIMGKVGRLGLAKALPVLRDEYQPDFVIANIENLAHGKGLTAKTVNEVKIFGIDGFTSGNHVWRKDDVQTVIAETGIALATPANDPRTPLNQQYILLKVGSKKLIMLNLLGRVFMREDNLSCPFKKADEILLAQQFDCPILIDFHGEATSEKVALGFYLDGRVGAILGTHTHIPTADTRILEKGTGYITDVGMVGPVDSVLGIKKEIIIEKFLTERPIIFDVPDNGLCGVNAMIIELDDQTGLCLSIKKLYQEVET